MGSGNGLGLGLVAALWPGPYAAWTDGACLFNVGRSADTGSFGHTCLGDPHPTHLPAARAPHCIHTGRPLPTHFSVPACSKTMGRMPPLCQLSLDSSQMAAAAPASGHSRSPLAAPAPHSQQGRGRWVAPGAGDARRACHPLPCLACAAPRKYERGGAKSPGCGNASPGAPPFITKTLPWHTPLAAAPPPPLLPLRALAPAEPARPHCPGLRGGIARAPAHGGVRAAAAAEAAGRPLPGSARPKLQHMRAQVQRRDPTQCMQGGAAAALPAHHCKACCPLFAGGGAGQAAGLWRRSLQCNTLLACGPACMKNIKGGKLQPWEWECMGL